MAEFSEEQNEKSLENKIQIFSNTDEKLKFLGKTLNNDSGRKILQLLIEKEMTANEIAAQTKLSLPLVLYHINQMIEAGIAVVSKTFTNGKNQPMKHYSAKPGIIILPEKASQKAKESKSFSNSLKRILSYAVVGIAGITTWFGTDYSKTQKIIEVPEEGIESPKAPTDYTDASSSNETIIPVEELTSQLEIFIPFLATAIVIGLGLFLIWFSKKLK